MSPTFTWLYVNLFLCLPEALLRVAVVFLQLSIQVFLQDPGGACMVCDCDMYHNAVTH